MSNEAHPSSVERAQAEIESALQAELNQELYRRWRVLPLDTRRQVADAVASALTILDEEKKEQARRKRRVKARKWYWKERKRIQEQLEKIAGYSGPRCQAHHPVSLRQLPPPPRLPGQGSRPVCTAVDRCGCAVVQRLVEALVVRAPPIRPEATLPREDRGIVLEGHRRIVHGPPSSLDAAVVTHAPPPVPAPGHRGDRQPRREGQGGQRRALGGGAALGVPVGPRLGARAHTPGSIHRRRAVPGHHRPARPVQPGHEGHAPGPQGERGALGTPDLRRPVRHQAPEARGRHLRVRPPWAEAGARINRRPSQRAHQPRPPLARPRIPGTAPPGSQAPPARAGRLGVWGVDHAPPPQVRGACRRRHIVHARARQPPPRTRTPEAARGLPPSIRTRWSVLDRGRFFVHPRQCPLQPADLLGHLPWQGCLIACPWAATAGAQVGQSLPQLPCPLADLGRVDLILRRQLLHALALLHRGPREHRRALGPGLSTLPRHGVSPLLAEGCLVPELTYALGQFSGTIILGFGIAPEGNASPAISVEMSGEVLRQSVEDHVTDSSGTTVMNAEQRAKSEVLRVSGGESCTPVWSRRCRHHGSACR